jgi:hypothetical protein
MAMDGRYAEKQEHYRPKMQEALALPFKGRVGWGWCLPCNRTTLPQPSTRYQDRHPGASRDPAPLLVESVLHQSYRGASLTEYSHRLPGKRLS